MSAQPAISRATALLAGNGFLLLSAYQFSDSHQLTYVGAGVALLAALGTAAAFLALDENSKRRNLWELVAMVCFALPVAHWLVEVTAKAVPSPLWS